MSNEPTITQTIRRILIPIFLVVLICGAGGIYLLLRHYAIERATQEARVVLKVAESIRGYTSDRVAPVVAGLPKDQFNEIGVPAFGAQAVFRTLHKDLPAYTYGEPALNPTNPQDRATPFQVELIDRFRSDPKLQELSGLRRTAAGPTFYLARPIKITDPACLECHSTPDRAPAAMVAKYGPHNGFGWTINETIGVQTLTVPMATQLQGMVELVLTVVAALVALFVVTYFALAFAFQLKVVRPLRMLAGAADAGSTSSDDRIVIPTAGTFEIRQIADAISRLRITAQKALRRPSVDAPAPKP